MDIARLSATGVAVAALVIGVTAAGCSKSEEKSESSTSAASSTTSAEASSSEESTTAETSAPPAEPSDYGSLLIPPTDVGADTQTPGGVQLNPGGNPGAAQVYSNPDGSQQITDTILVFPDVAAADSNFQSNSATMNTEVTGAPGPVEIGDQGMMAAGTSPDGSKEVTEILFTVGRVLVNMSFKSAPGDPVPPEVAHDIATKQAAAVEAGLPAE
jgi:cytoskeletal protein RodZ